MIDEPDEKQPLKAPLQTEEDHVEEKEVDLDAPEEEVEIDLDAVDELPKDTDRNISKLTVSSKDTLGLPSDGSERRGTNHSAPVKVDWNAMAKSPSSSEKPMSKSSRPVGAKATPRAIEDNPDFDFFANQVMKMATKQAGRKIDLFALVNIVVFITKKWQQHSRMFKKSKKEMFWIARGPTLQKQIQEIIDKLYPDDSDSSDSESSSSSDSDTPDSDSTPDAEETSTKRSTVTTFSGFETTEQDEAGTHASEQTSSDIQIVVEDGKNDKPRDSRMSEMIPQENQEAVKGRFWIGWSQRQRIDFVLTIVSVVTAVIMFTLIGYLVYRWYAYNNRWKKDHETMLTHTGDEAVETAHEGMEYGQDSDK